MTVGVMTILEGPLRDEALRLWRIFEMDHGSVGVQSFAHPNLTFGVGRCREPEVLARRLAELAGELRPFELRVSGVGFFSEPQRVAYLRVAVTRQLGRIHRSVDKVLEECCDEPAGIYRPARWIPHVTIAMGDLSQGAFETARSRFATYDREFVQAASRICLVQSSPAGTGFEVVGEWSTGSGGT